MFRGFELSVPDDFFHEYKDAGDTQHRKNKRLVDGRLSQFRSHSGDLLSKKMTAVWFPEIDAQVSSRMHIRTVSSRSVCPDISNGASVSRRSLTRPSGAMRMIC